MKTLTTILTAVALMGITASSAHAGNVPTHFCGGSGYNAVWAGAHTSCAMAKATRSTVQRVASQHGETPARVVVWSSVTHRYYTMHLAGGMYHHGSTPVAKWIGGGSHGSQITVFFWIP